MKGAGKMTLKTSAKERTPMSTADITELIDTHNANIKQFERFCKKLDDLNGGSFPVSVWFQLFQAVPDFSRLAGVITRIARDAGIDAKYSAQDGNINVYETLGDSEGMEKSGQTEEEKNLRRFQMKVKEIDNFLKSKGLV